MNNILLFFCSFTLLSACNKQEFFNIDQLMLDQKSVRVSEAALYQLYGKPDTVIVQCGGYMDQQKNKTFRTKCFLYDSFKFSERKGTAMLDQIDFGKGRHVLENGELKIDRSYTIHDFKKSFPTAYKMRDQSPGLTRTMDDYDQTQMSFATVATQGDSSYQFVEFTFERDSLLWVFFY